MANDLQRNMESVMLSRSIGMARPCKVLYLACIAVTAVQCKVLFSDWLVCEHNEYNLLCVFHRLGQWGIVRVMIEDMIMWLSSYLVGATLPWHISSACGSDYHLPAFQVLEYCL